MSEPSLNPYEAPKYTEELAAPPSTLSLAFVSQQRVVAILLIIHGVMLIGMGIFLLGMAIFLPAQVAANMRQQGGPKLPNAEEILLVLYGGMALCGIIPGILQIYAGAMNFVLKKPTLGMVALGCGMLSVGTCYCIPSALALLVYGLVIYTNESVRRAFELAKQGKTFDEIIQIASGGRP